MSLWDMYDWRNDPHTINWQQDFTERAEMNPRPIPNPDYLPSGKYGKPPAKTQIGGDHYLSFKIQPLEFSMANKLDACQHSIMKYITRRKGDKAKRLEDIDKAMHVLEYYKSWIIENE